MAFDKHCIVEEEEDFYNQILSQFLMKIENWKAAHLRQKKKIRCRDNLHLTNNNSVAIAQLFNNPIHFTID